MRLQPHWMFSKKSGWCSGYIPLMLLKKKPRCSLFWKPEKHYSRFLDIQGDLLYWRFIILLLWFMNKCNNITISSIHDINWICIKSALMYSLIRRCWFILCSSCSDPNVNINGFMIVSKLYLYFQIILDIVYSLICHIWSPKYFPCI